jgi:hypothetical protein
VAPNNYVPENKLWKHVSTVEADIVFELKHCDEDCTAVLQGVPLRVGRRPAIHEVFKYNKVPVGRAIAQALSRRLSTATARVRAQVRSCAIFGEQTGTGTAFLLVLRFPLPVLIPPTAQYSSSSSSIIWGWLNRPNSGRSTKWTQSLPTPKN